MINGVMVTPLRQYSNEQGKIMKIISRNDAVYREFGEVYISTVYPGVVKGWSYHFRMTLNYAVPIGEIKLVLYDNREESSTCGEIMEIISGMESYQLVTVPPRIWYGFQGRGTTMAMIINCATHPHDPDEIKKLDPYHSSIPYTW